MDAMLVFFESFFNIVFWITLTLVILGGVNNDDEVAFTWFICLIVCVISFSISKALDQEIKNRTPVPIVSTISTNTITITNTVFLEKQ